MVEEQPPVPVSLVLMRGEGVLDRLDGVGRMLLVLEVGDKIRVIPHVDAEKRWDMGWNSLALHLAQADFQGRLFHAQMAGAQRAAGKGIVMASDLPRNFDGQVKR